MTIREALISAVRELKNFPTAQLDSELLLSTALGVSREQLVTGSNENIQKDQEVIFDQFVQERKKGKPVAYISSRKEFYGRTFFVDERVLIPRPETEELVELTLQQAQKHPEISTYIDLGTGSGCISITLSLELPSKRVIGLDVSPAALEVANLNREHHGASDLELIASDLLGNLPSDIPGPIGIITNLPYIGTDSFSSVDEHTATYEPSTALYGGPDGLDLYRRSWKQIKELKLPVQLICMEIFPGQEKLLEEECEHIFPKARFSSQKDLSGKARFVILEWGS